MEKMEKQPLKKRQLGKKQLLILIAIAAVTTVAVILGILLNPPQTPSG